MELLYTPKLKTQNTESTKNAEATIDEENTIENDATPEDSNQMELFSTDETIPLEGYHHEA